MKGLTFIFDGDKLVTEVNGERHEGTFTIGSGRMPRHIDLKPAAGNTADKPLQGVYWFESRNNLRICFGQKRPGSLHTHPGTDAILLELKRTPPRESPIKVTATDLLSDCRSNRSVAAAKYKDEVIEVTGTVMATKDGRVLLAAGEGEGRRDYVECTFSQNYKSELFRMMQIKPDQSVKLRGTFNGTVDSRGKMATFVQILNCEVVETAPGAGEER
jgi:uncharacterized protein (TIGR03067 family)